MTKEKKVTLEQLQKISEKTGIPIRELQEEYGLFEFVFSALIEAQKGYNKILEKYEENKDHREFIAYVDAWKALTESEYIILDQENLDQIMYFLNNCFPSNDVLIKGLELVKTNIGSDLQKKVVFIKTINTNRQNVKYKDCPVYQYKEEIFDQIDEHFYQKIGNKNKLCQYSDVWDELAKLEINHWSKFPKFKKRLSQRMISTAKTPEDLLALPYKETRGVLIKWNYFSKIQNIGKILPTLRKFLCLINEDDHESYKRPNEAQYKVRQLFKICENESQAKQLMDIARPFYYVNDEERKKYEDVLYNLYKDSISRIIHKNFPHPKLANFKHITDVFKFNKCELQSAEVEWMKKSRLELKKPIPDFYKTFNQIHNDYKSELLAKWNNWGTQQFNEMITWEELSHFNYLLLPLPGDMHRPNRYFWQATRKTFSSFILLLNKLIEVIPREHEDKLLNLINHMDKCSSEVYAYGLFKEEKVLLLRKIIKSNPSMEKLNSLYINNLPEWEHTDVSDFYAPVLEVIIDEILERDFTYFDKIFAKIKTSSYLKSKYIKIKVGKIMVI